MVRPLFKHNASNFQELRASVCTIAFQMTHDRNNSWIKPTLSQISDIYLISTWLQLQASCHIFGKNHFHEEVGFLGNVKGTFLLCVRRCWASGIISTVNISRFGSRKTCDNSTNILSPGKSSTEESERAKNHIGKILITTCVYISTRCACFTADSLCDKKQY